MAAALMTLAAVFSLLLLWQSIFAHACTTIVVGRQATADGSLMVTHNNDCEDCDVRIGIVPGTRVAPGEKIEDTPIHPSLFEFPRYVGLDRGDLYRPEHITELEDLPNFTAKETKPIGFISGVAHTYQYIDGSYGMMNEAQLAIGESTCAAKIVAYSRANGGDALFDASAVTRVAMQRCATARCAVKLMGALAEKHGFYGAEDPLEKGDDLFEVAGEALTIIDTHEAWVMHLLADPSGTSAVWAAQRVPSDHLAAIPNKFIIDAMNLTDSRNFLASENMIDVALDSGFLTKELHEKRGGEQGFQFSEAFALDFELKAQGRNAAEAERRRWRVFSIVAPSQGFQPDQLARFPFSVKVEHPIDVADLKALMRDHFEGTPFDQTIGLAAGPFGNPNRYDRNSEVQPEVRNGFFERTISIHRTSYSFVAVSKAHNESSSENEDQSEPAREALGGQPDAGNVTSIGSGNTTNKESYNGFGGILWLAHHSPQNSLYMPLSAKTRALPDSFGRGNLYKMDRLSAWWSFCAVSNNAERMYAPIHAYISNQQKILEGKSTEEVVDIGREVNERLDAGREEEAIDLLTEFTVQHNTKLVARWWSLGDELTTIFRDGMQLQSSQPPLELKHLFYPVWWLKEVGYFTRGPLSNPTYPALPAHMHPTPVSAASQTANENEAASEEQLVMAFPHIHTPEATTKLVHHDREHEHKEQHETDRDQVEQSEKDREMGSKPEQNQPPPQKQPQHMPQGAPTQPPRKAETEPKPDRKSQESKDADRSADDSKKHRGHSRSHPSREDPEVDAASFGSWVRSQRTLALGLFLLVVVLISILFFQLGKMCARRGGYQAVGEDEAGLEPRGYEVAGQKSTR